MRRYARLSLNDKSERKKAKKVGRPVKAKRSEWSDNWHEPDSGKYSRRTEKLPEDRIEKYLIENYYEMTHNEIASKLGIKTGQVDYFFQTLLHSLSYTCP